MRRIPDILNTSLQSSVRSCSSNQAISKSVHSYSNNNSEKFDCQLSDKQIIYCNEFLSDNLTSSQFRVFNSLMELSLKYKNLHPSLDLLAQMSQCARSTVQLAIKRLRELNIIETESRGYHQTLSYRIHEFYLTNRNKIASLVKNVFMVATLLLSSITGSLGNRYLLKEKDVYFRLTSKKRGVDMSLNLSKDQYTEIRSHPDYVFDRTLAIFEKKMKEGLAIANHASYFMGIFRQEAAKKNAAAEPTYRQFKNKDPKTGTTKPYERPKTGPYAEYIPPPKREIENDFDMSVKLEMAFHTKPNMFSQLVADMNLKKLSKEEHNAIMMIVHKDCECRPNLGIED